MDPAIYLNTMCSIFCLFVCLFIICIFVDGTIIQSISWVVVVVVASLSLSHAIQNGQLWLLTPNFHSFILFLYFFTYLDLFVVDGLFHINSMG